MLMEEIQGGENRNLEFKELLADNNSYMKTVVAFANGAGGKIIFGISDKNKEVVGVEPEKVFRSMDAIANSISDSCQPAIMPDISLQTIQGKTVIVVEIEQGRQRPYYIKKLGIEGGVYVRVGGTTRPADPIFVKELMFQGSNRSFDQCVCLGWEISDDDIEQLCGQMKIEAVKNAWQEEKKAQVKDVTKQQLLSWGILIEKEGKICPTNGFAILSGRGPIQVATQCGLFKGKTKEYFIDRKEYTGPIWEQIEQAYQYVLAKINMRAEFAGLYRRDIYEIPEYAIREFIVNAAVHRSYLDHGNIQVAVYDDRVEITSPGGLYLGQTIDKMKAGYSKIRNEALAHAFEYMNLMEHWGSGIPKSIRKMREEGLPEPEFIDGDVDLRINLYRADKGANAVKETAIKELETADKCRQTADKLPTNLQERAIYQYILENGSITTQIALQLLQVKERRARQVLVNMVEKGILRKEGASRNTIYLVK